MEDDDESSPKFLRESLLGKERAEQVIEAIKEVIGRLPSYADEEQEMGLGISAGGQKASAKGVKIVEEGKEIAQKGKVKAGLKKPAARKHPVCSPSPAPLASKPSPTIKDANSPARNTRSQRQRKPSRKRRGSDYA